MTVVFADTFYYIALLNRMDRAHVKASNFTASFRGIVVTSEWILLELADALDGTTAGRAEVVTTINDLRADPDVEIVTLSSGLMAEGLDLFSRRPDKQWSLSDCISFVVMEREGISDALTGDKHFEQAGFNVLLK
jgi:predicted nucleic acid-binding protein